MNNSIPAPTFGNTELEDSEWEEASDWADRYVAEVIEGDMTPRMFVEEYFSEEYTNELPEQRAERLKKLFEDAREMNMGVTKRMREQGEDDDVIESNIYYGEQTFDRLIKALEDY